MSTSAESTIAGEVVAAQSNDQTFKCNTRLRANILQNKT